MVHERKAGLEPSVAKDDEEPRLDNDEAETWSDTAGEEDAERRDVTYGGKEEVVDEHGREEEGKQGEEHRAEQKLVDRVVVRVQSVPEHVHALPCDSQHAKESGAIGQRQVDYRTDQAGVAHLETR